MLLRAPKVEAKPNLTVRSRSACDPVAMVSQTNGWYSAHVTDSPTTLTPVDQVVDAVLAASRALVGVAARSLSGLPEGVTLPQYRALVVLASRGPQTVGALADALDIAPSTTTRLCDRLVAKRLIRRATSPESRRVVVVTLAARGRNLVDGVTTRRRRDIERIVTALDAAQRDAVIAAFERFTDAAGEPRDSAWALAWDIP
jgi:DNA-binding MarR family transcriptional regulator